MPKLRNRKQEHFANEIATFTPLARAYKIAGFGGDERWHPFNASKLANKPHVRARIEELRRYYDEMTGLHVAYVQQQLLPLLEANAQDFVEPIVNADGKIIGDRARPLSSLPRSVTAAVSKIKVTDPDTGVLTEITLADKNGVGNTLLRSVGGLLDRTEHSLKTDVGSQLDAAFERRRALVQGGDAMLLEHHETALPARTIEGEHDAQPLASPRDVSE